MTLAVDTSAIQAIVKNEPEAPIFRALLRASTCMLSSGSFVELIRLSSVRGGRAGAEAAERLLDDFRIEVVPFDRAQAELAREGALRFGKGRGAPPAVLNFGDLFAYALARHLDAPLLFKGNDFGQTDVKVALPTP